MSNIGKITSTSWEWFYFVVSPLPSFWSFSSAVPTVFVLTLLFLAVLAYFPRLQFLEAFRELVELRLGTNVDEANMPVKKNCVSILAIHNHYV